MKFRLHYRCDRVWESFSGEGPERHCDGCDKPVYDWVALSEERKAEVRKNPLPCLKLPLAMAILSGCPTPEPPVAHNEKVLAPIPEPFNEQEQLMILGGYMADSTEPAPTGSQPHPTGAAHGGMMMPKGYR